ncbi:MAG TPA: NHL repeat-containing protein [Solirubrobacterales bacterium]
MRWGIRFALLAVVLGLVFPGSAAAFGLLSSFGEFGSGAGQLDSPAQMTLDSEGDIYVADGGNDRISVFAGDGTFLRSFGQGVMLEPSDVALDGGRVFVADRGKDRIDVFTAEAEFLFSFGAGKLIEPTGVAVDGSTVFVADSGNDRVAAFTSTGAFLYPIEPIPSVRDVIVGGGGNLFAADFGNQRVDVFTKAGVGPIRSIGEDGEGELSGPVALVADGLGGIYVADQVAERLVHFKDDGGFLGSFDAEPNVAGIGVACQGNVFAVEAGIQLARVVRFGEPGTPPPPCAEAQPEEPVQVPAIKLPSSRFHFAGLVKNRSNGYAVLYARVPGPGRLNLTGRGFRRLSRSAQQATTVVLPIKPKVRLRHFLKQHGKGTIRVVVTFTPSEGVPRTLEKVIVLRRHRG